MKIMELNDLRSDWQNAGASFKSKTDIQNMTKIAHHPTLKKIRKKLIIETIFLINMRALGVAPSGTRPDIFWLSE